MITMVLLLQCLTIYKISYPEQYTRDCIILDKIDYVRETKYKSSSNYYPEKAFHVRWLDDNREGEVSVDSDTFYNTKIGEKTGFIYTKPFTLLDTLIAVISLIALVLELVSGIIMILVKMEV